MRSKVRRVEGIPTYALVVMLMAGFTLHGCDGQEERAQGNVGHESSETVLTVPPPEEYYEMSKEESLASLERNKKITERTIGYVLEGRWGELVWCDERFALSPMTIRLVQADNGFELLRRDRKGDFVLHGAVDKKGTYTVGEKGLSNLNTSRSPANWDLTALKKSANEVPVGTSLFSSTPKVSDRPANAVGWLFVTRYSGFLAVSIDVVPPPDIIWVVETEDGLDFVHSGPTDSGLYAQVDQDGVIHFHELFAGALNKDWSDGKWKVLNKDRKPVFTALIGGFPERLQLNDEIIVGPGGRLMMVKGPVSN